MSILYEFLNEVTRIIETDYSYIEYIPPQQYEGGGAEYSYTLDSIEVLQEKPSFNISHFRANFKCVFYLRYGEEPLSWISSRILAIEHTNLLDLIANYNNRIDHVEIGKVKFYNSVRNNIKVVEVELILEEKNIKQKQGGTYGTW